MLILPPFFLEKQLYKHVTTHTASFWAHSFVTQLISISEQQSLQSHATPALDVNSLVSTYIGSKKRLLFFDYDVSSRYIYQVTLPLTPRRH